METRKFESGYSKLQKKKNKSWTFCWITKKGLWINL